MHPLAVHAELVLVGPLVQVHDGDEVLGGGTHTKLLPVVERTCKLKSIIGVVLTVNRNENIGILLEKIEKVCTDQGTVLLTPSPPCMVSYGLG